VTGLRGRFSLKKDVADMENIKFNKLSDCCQICEGEIEAVIELPKLPLTGIYTELGNVQNTEDFDQVLMLCEKCGHAQLKYSISPEYLYGNTYSFRTSESNTASKGSDFFLNYLENLFPGRIFKRIVEFGCNDAYLLELLSKKSEQLLGVDPIWKDRENEYHHEKISVVGKLLQDVDVETMIGGKPDLIVSQHTMEHIENPKTLLNNMLNKAGDDTVFLFEFPCLDPLLEKYRFDQVFHQHLQYYSVQSFLILLDSVGCELIDYTFNYNYWGALLIAFRKKKKQGDFNVNKIMKESYPKKTSQEIKIRFKLFKKQMKATRTILDGLESDKLYGYGAALMLPILGYHLSTDFSEFQAIFDDDPKKDGLGYPNLNVKIKQPKDEDLSSLSICLTAIDNRRPILINLVTKQPKHIINPLHII
jgi:hypothetical protein